MRQRALVRAMSLLLVSLFATGVPLALPQITSAQDQDQAPGAPPEQGPAQAQAPPQSQPPQAGSQSQADPPGVVARLNYMRGSVSFQPAGTKDWVDANPNRPLTTGDNLWADQDSRGEVHIGSTVLRLSSQTGISFLNLNDQATQLQLPQGSLNVRLRELPQGETFEIDTPNVAISLLQPGEYRVNVDPNGSATVIMIRNGSGEATGGGKTYRLDPGQQFTFTGSDQLAYDAAALPPRDEFDNWCSERDLHEEQSVSARYVSRDVTGYDDLDKYGTWRPDPGYGQVWYPSHVVVGWAPYHYGHWVFIAPWGWTWVEDEPWGFAPFHYGRWAIVGGVWGWVPGPVGVHVGVFVGGPIVRPIYAPALVGFVGGGFGVSVGFGGVAGVAWFPLGPRDVWVPGYHCSAVYVRNVNVTNTRVVNVTQVTNVYNNYNRNVNVTNNYTYAHNVTAVTAVNRNTFINGGAVGHASMHVTADQIEHPQVVNHAQLQPTQRSFVGTAGTARATPPASLANRPVVTKLAPSPRAVPIGHTQPLATSQNGQFNRPAGQGQFHSFQPPAHGNANAGANARVNGNANRPAHPSGNFHAPPHPSSGTQGPRPAVQRANGGNTGSQSHAQNQHHQQPRPENNKGEGKKPEKGQ